MPRFEVNHDGMVVEAETALCANKDQLIDNMLCQYHHTVNEVFKDGPYRKIEIVDANGNLTVVNVFSGNIRNEARNPYEKKIQLNGKDPRPLKNQNTIILGIYVSESDDSLADALVVGYPIDDNVNYDTNPSIRGTFVNRILVNGKNQGFYYDEETNRICFRPEFIFYYLNNYKSIQYGEAVDNVQPTATPYADDFEIGENLLLYGVPGCGKSHFIETNICVGVDEEHKERVVFHPDYTYSDFVGQILPKSEGGEISYPFIEGPFTRILKKALSAEHTNEMFYLIIEEINRGNAPAIFGDLFQLLDRDCTGKSEYEITNFDIASKVFGEGREDEKIYIPSNLFILATMNTADQNVFTLDTAFKRRWHMKSIKNRIEDCDHANTQICGTALSWYDFATEINKYIIETGEGNLSSEDNRLGAWFVKEDDLHDAKAFAEKVLMYLWNDAFKFSRTDVFKSEYKTLDDVIDGFQTVRFGVFTTRFNCSNFNTFNEPEINEDVVDETVNAPTVESHLQGKPEKIVELYNRFMEQFTTMFDDIDVGATAQYIRLKSGNSNIAEVHVNRNSIVVHTKEPTETEYQIGERVPDSYGWALNYKITLTEENIEVVCQAINHANEL